MSEEQSVEQQGNTEANTEENNSLLYGEGGSEHGNPNPEEGGDDKNASEENQGGDKKDDDNQDDKSGESEGEEQEGAPESYEFEVPEGIEINPETQEKFEKIARDYNLSNEQAQALIDLQVEASTRSKENLQEQFTQQKKAWEEESLADEEFGGPKFESSIKTAARALDSFGTPKLKELLNESGLGNHPEMIRFVVKVGNSIGEDTLEVGGQPSSKKSDADILYGENN
ncbi:MAG: peptidase [Thiomicrospira sp.]|nr:MAG: peptidase [Thiomicrospira sp.]